MRQARKPIFVREWRKHRGLTLESLAERMHMHKGALSRIERGERPYNQDFLEAVAEQLSCDVVDLLIRNPLDTEAPWSIWERIPEQARPQAKAVLETFVDDKVKKTG